MSVNKDFLMGYGAGKSAHSAKTVHLSGENLITSGALGTDGLDNLTASTIRLRTSGYYAVKPSSTCTVTATVKSGVTLYFAASFYTANDFATSRIDTTSWIQYSSTKTFSVPSGATYVRLTFKNGSDATISPLDITSFSLTDGESTYVINCYDTESCIQYIALNTNGSEKDRNTQSSAVSDGFFFSGDAKVLEITAPTGYLASLLFYSSPVRTASAISETDYGSFLFSSVPDGGYYFRVRMKAENGNAFSVGKISNVEVKFIDKKSTEEIGELTYNQSFTRYGGKYYSTDGSHIGVQSSSFEAETSVDLSVGHGNGFQLGSSNIAYVSGWDDQKIYAVDLDTVSIDSEITLPTTGYTTSVIDDVNHIAYIYQRDSFPSTIATYNFITYDLANQQTLSTKTINAFAAMQAADMYNGKIVVTWGGGIASQPSGMAIYNTSGDILAMISLDIFLSVEPEGVFIDRKTGEILISLVNKKCYKIIGIKC